ncbi:MAG: aldolase/citrate lyase family protein, partial [Pseudoflavonifractor sp.]
RANEQLLTMIAIETLEGAAHVEEMMTVPHLDGIFIGPMDLSTNMGHFGNPAHPEVQAKIREIEAKVLARGDMLLGSVAADAKSAKALYDRGYNYVIFASDTTTLRGTMCNMIKEFKEYSAV